MNERDEQRVIEALHNLTGGLTVTEHDILTAGSRLHDRLETPPPRRRLPLVAAVVVALALVGYALFGSGQDEDSAPPADRPPAPSAVLKAALQKDAYRLGPAGFSAGTTPTAADLTGLWLLRAPYDMPMFVDGDGGWWMGAPGSTGGFGTSTLSGARWDRHLDDGSGCAESADLTGYVQAWHASSAGDGSLRLQLTNRNVTCTPAEEREVWDRVSPGSPVGDYLVASARDAAWRPAPAGFGWAEALYVAPATGHVLAVEVDGHYRYYDALGDTLAPTDEGELSTQQGRAVGTCTGGSFAGRVEVAALPGVLDYVLPHDALRISGDGSGCSSGVDDEGTWVNLSS